VQDGATPGRYPVRPRLVALRRNTDPHVHCPDRPSVEADSVHEMLLAHDVHGRDDAEPVVLIHGITESRAAWDPLLDDLGGSFRLLTVDLRGHGDSEVAGPYDPISYAGDVVETMTATGFAGATVVGHSLGGIVASAVAALGTTRRVINIDQSIRLSGFKALIGSIEPQLRGDEATFRSTMEMVFATMLGPLPPEEVERLDSLRHARQDVVLGTWESVLESTEAELDATVAALADAITVPYLALHGMDPGDGYAEWLGGLVPTATVELWADHGHYPHLVDRARFVTRLREFVGA